MTYRELLDLYREGKLAEKQAKEVEADIEKHEAISDYLLDEGDAAVFDAEEEMDLNYDAEDTASAEFAKMVNKSIRRAFRRLGITIFAVTLVAVLLVQFVLPDLVASRYYNPEQMGLDMAVYTELNYPLDYRSQVAAEDRGYGNYDVRIYKNYGLGYERMTDVTGKIEKGKLTLYNEDFRVPYGNSFQWNAANDYFDIKMPTANTKEPITSFFKTGAPYEQSISEMRTANRESAEKLNDGDLFTCYVTPTKQMKYEDFIRFMEKNDLFYDVWCAVRYRDGQCLPSMGFQSDAFFSTPLDWDTEKYPKLQLWSEKMTEKEHKQEETSMKTEEGAKTHFISMLKYLGDRTEFMQMITKNEGFESYDDAIEYIEKNGLIIYGFAVVTDKENALKILDTEGIYSVDAQPL